MNLSREYTAILENAYDVGYEKIENEIGSIEFSMPLYDTKNAMIQALQYVELTDNEDEYIGLYRIMPSTIQKDKSNYTIKYTAMHVLGTLLDSVLFGYHELVNRTTKDVINYILGKQKQSIGFLRNVSSLGISAMHGKMRTALLMHCFLFRQHLTRTIFGNGTRKFIPLSYPLLSHRLNQFVGFKKGTTWKVLR